MDEATIERVYRSSRQADGLPLELPAEAFTIAASILRKTEAVASTTAPATSSVPSTAATLATREAS